MGALIRIELKRLARTRALRLLLVLALLLGLTSAGASLFTALSQTEARDRAAALAQGQWDSLGDYNPHSAAHFGRFAFRPLGALSLLERGVEPYMGDVVHMEAHRQKEAVFSQASQQPLAFRADSLEPGFILHGLLPLLLILAVARSVEETRVSGRMAMLLARGVSGLGVILSASGVIWAIGGGLALGLILLQGLLAWGLGLSMPWGALGIYIGLTLIYYLIVVSIGAGASALLKHPGGATPLLISLMLFWSLILPRLGIHTASILFPLPGRVAEEDMKARERREGFDGHNPADARRAAIEARVLAEYGVERKEDLPINLDGILMQEDEAFGDAIWDAHFQSRIATFEAQEAVMQLLALLNPFAAVKGLTRGLAGTDTASAVAFQQQAEAYRRELIRALNHAHAYGGSRTGDWSWKADGTLYEALPPFVFEPPPLNARLVPRWRHLLGLALWVLIAVVVAITGGRRLEVRWDR